MTHSLSLTNGTTTVTLTAGDYLLQRYTPEAPVMNFDALSVADFDAFDDVTEVIDVYVSNASKTTVQSDVRAIERLLSEAQLKRISGFGDDVYLQIQIDGESGTWETEIFGGSVVLDRDTLKEWANSKAEISIEITRRYYWENTSATTATTTTAAGSGGTIYNSDDTSGTQQNWIQFTGPATGSIPSPLKVAITNASGTALDTRKFYIANNVFNDPANFSAWLKAADLDVGTATQSGSASDHGTIRYAWDLSTAQLADCKGHYFRILACFNDISTGTYVKARVFGSIGGIRTEMLDNGEVYTRDVGGQELLDLGAVPIPPGGKNSAGSSVAIVLSIRASNTWTANLSHVQLTPTTSFRLIEKIGFQSPSGGIITDNGIDGTAYTGSDSSRQPIVIQRHKPVYAWPARTNRLYILFNEIESYVSGRQSTVAVSWKERRLTI